MEKEGLRKAALLSLLSNKEKRCCREDEVFFFTLITQRYRQEKEKEKSDPFSQRNLKGRVKAVLYFLGRKRETNSSLRE